jgi:nickel-dependent lactate racemase
MATYQLPYGRGELELSLDTAAQVEFILPQSVAGAPDPDLAIWAALDNPADGQPLASFANANTVAIAINDKTRPVPHAQMLPPLLRALEHLGFAPDAITLIIATGTHIPMTPDTFGNVVPPEILERYAVVSHDCDATDLVGLGTTELGTPVWMNRRYMQADLRIVTGNVEPHHFAGYSGGVKSAAIGLAGRETITANHSLLMDPRSALAIYDENPLRQDIEAIGGRVGIHFALNVVMNDHKEIAAAYSGNPRAVIAAAIPKVRSIYEVSVNNPYDVMITCPGGYPKDINLYQAHKAVSCANRVTKENGVIILVAACEDGAGSQGYEAFMHRGFSSHAAAMAQFAREPFRIGPHKAYIFGRDAVRLKRIYVVSDMAPDRVQRLLLSPSLLHDAVAAAIRDLPDTARVGIMPYANATIPVLA